MKAARMGGSVDEGSYGEVVWMKARMGGSVDEGSYGG